MENKQQQEKIIQVSANYRWIENGHIFLWLIKDTCWALEFKAGGIFMVIPTVSVAFYILWNSRRIRTELFHNIAVCLWILANSGWMIGEFFEYEARPFAAALFIAGLILLIVYYVFFFRKDRRKERQLNMGVSIGNDNIKRKEHRELVSGAKVS